MEDGVKTRSASRPAERRSSPRQGTHASASSQPHAASQRQRAAAGPSVSKDRAPRTATANTTTVAAQQATTLRHRAPPAAASSRPKRKAQAEDQTAPKKARAAPVVATSSSSNSKHSTGLSATAAAEQAKHHPRMAPVGKVQLLPRERRGHRTGQASADAFSHIHIKRRPRVKVEEETPPVQAAQNRPIGFHCFQEWIDKDLEAALVKMFHQRLQEEGIWEDLMLDKKAGGAGGNAQEDNCSSAAQDHGTETKKNRKSRRIADVANLPPGVAGTRIGFAPYTLRDSHCIRAMHCAHGADKPIQISEGRLGQDTRFMVEEMPEILHEIAEEIRAEFPYELEPPSLDYAQVNVITIPEVPKTSPEPRTDDEAIAVSPDAPPEEGKFERSNSKRRVVLDYHKDHLVLGDIAVLCLQGDCTLRMRKGPIEFAQVLKPRTLYMLRGPAREIWEHAVDDVHGERISIVFRSKRQ